MIIPDSHPATVLRRTNLTTGTTSPAKDHSNRSSLQTSRRTSSEIQVNQEDSTDTNSSATNDQGVSNVGEKLSTATNCNFNQEFSFSRRRKGAKFPRIDSLVPWEELYDRLMSYR